MVAPNQPNRPKFSLGKIVATPGALEALRRRGEAPEKFLSRHAAGDWGDVDAGDARLNDEAVIAGERLLSAYTLQSGERLWIITEAADATGRRTATTLLLPDEY